MPRKPNTSGEHYNDPFPTVLRELIEENGTRQDELKEVLEVKNRQSVTGYVDGSTIPTIDKAKALAEFFHVSVDYMLTGNPCLRPEEPDKRAICDYTGLSEGAALSLHALNRKAAEYADLAKMASGRNGADYFVRAQHEIHSEQRLISRFFEDENIFRSFFDALSDVSSACSKCRRLVEEETELQGIDKRREALADAEKDLKVSLSDFSLASTIVLNSLVDVYDVRSRLAGEILRIEKAYSESLRQRIERAASGQEAHNGEHKED